MIELTEEHKELLKQLMQNSAKKGNLANAGVVLENGKVIARAESLVGSNKDATAHSERMLVQTVGKLKQNNYTPGLTMVSVCEPCVMCIGACTLAGYNELAYIIPAKRYAKKISFFTNDTKVDKEKLAGEFDKPIKLIHMKEFEEEFCKVFEEAMVWILKK
jgi:guanine deaminase